MKLQLALDDITLIDALVLVEKVRDSRWAVLDLVLGLMYIMKLA